MILPPGTAGVAFSEAADGDMRHDEGARRRLSTSLGVSERWGTLRQVHGAKVLQVSEPGLGADADAQWTTVPGLPLAVYVADCFGVVVHGDGVVGVAHAGWRGARSGVVSALLDAMRDSGHIPNRAVIGPGIRSCCFEVGPSVAAQFPDAVTETTWGGVSVDLPAVITAQLSEVEVDVVDGCTRHEEKYFSHRRDGLPNRQVALGWMR